MLQFSSAYEQLRPHEREFVNGFLRQLETEATRRFERLTTTLERLSSAIDPDALDERTKLLFSSPLIVAAIRERAEAMAAETDLTPQRVIREHAAIGLANINRFFKVGEDGFATFDASECTAVDWSAVQSIETEEITTRQGVKRTVKLKMHSKQSALDSLSKFMGLDKAENVEYAAYKTLPSDLVKIPVTASIDEAAERYAKLING